MRLLRYETANGPRLGVLKGDGIVSLEALGADYPTMRSVVAAGGAALSRIAELVAVTAPSLTLSEARLLAPIERPG